LKITQKNRLQATRCSRQYSAALRTAASRAVVGNYENMKNTRWRDIIVSNLIGIAFGVVLISVGFKFIAENVRTSIVTAIILIIVSGILIIIVYRYRKNAIATLTGIKESDINNIKESIEQLDGSIKNKNPNKAQISRASSKSQRHRSSFSVPSRSLAKKSVAVADLI